VRRTRLLALSIASAALAACLLAAAASAFYDNGFDAVPGALLISADYARHEQGDDTTKFATVSADGRYAAIETFSRNFFADDDPDPPGKYRAGGLFRFDLQSRALQKIADGNLFEEGGEGKFLQRGASNPSISADGRFVAFSTAERLIPADGNENVDAYVRDMDLPLPAGGACTAEPSPPCPFRLVSARDGSDDPATYGPAGSPVPGGAPGAEVSRGVAISADGQRVAFRTEAPSDLPASPTATVPAGQVFVRDLAARTTALISEELEPASGLMTEQPAGGALGAAISGDGSTVAWTGRNAPAQTRFVAGENTDANFNYYLWRRVADGPGAPVLAGPQAPTRRITGLADPDDPLCRQAEEANPGMTTNFDSTSTGPCFGPLTDQEANRSDISSQLPALSRDGYTVAFLTGAGPRPIAFTGPGLDLYVTRMNPGLSRKQATAELTRDTASFEPAISSPISSVAISADGRYLALTSSRTQFTLPVLQMVGAPRAVAGPHELYLIDLAEHTIERAAHSTAAGDINGEVQDGVSLSVDGSRIAFTSFAGNLFLGDSNQRTDAFVVTREDEAGPEGGSGGGADGGLSSIETFGNGPHIAARLRSVHGAVAVLSVSVPAAGRLEATATASTHRGGRPEEIADGSARAKAKGNVKLTLHLRASLLKTLKSSGKIRARASVAFVPAVGGRRLTTSLPVAFFSKSSQLRHK
jgi:Tol biopolymer transport system component